MPRRQPVTKRLRQSLDLFLFLCIAIVEFVLNFSFFLESIFPDVFLIPTRLFNVGRFGTRVSYKVTGPGVPVEFSSAFLFSFSMFYFQMPPNGYVSDDRDSPPPQFLFTC